MTIEYNNLHMNAVCFAELNKAAVAEQAARDDFCKALVQAIAPELRRAVLDALATDLGYIAVLWGVEDVQQRGKCCTR
jgi:hypothetical protein